MRIDKLACLCALVSLPSAAVAQTSFTPLPPVPRMEPLYPAKRVSQPTSAPRQVRHEPSTFVPAQARYTPPAPISAPVVVASLPRPAAPVMPVAAPAKSVAPPTLVLPTAPAAPAPMLASRSPLPQAESFLPANSEVLLRLDEEVNSEGRKVGATFRMTVVQNVMFNGAIAIPAGTPAFGKVTWRTGKGMFGKSGKISIAVDSLQLNGRTVPLSGEFREDGRGRTGATIGIAILAGVAAAAFVTGHDAAFNAGRELRVKTLEPLAVTSPVASDPPVLVAQAQAAP